MLFITPSANIRFRPASSGFISRLRVGLSPFPSANAICSSRHRPLSGSEDPSHRAPVQTQAAGRAQPLWERPWPRQGRCNLQFSAPATVGVKTPPTEVRSRLKPQVLLSPCGRGSGRDRAAAICSSRHRPPSGSEDPSHKAPAPASTADRPPPCKRQALQPTATEIEAPYIFQLTATQAARSGMG